MRTSSSSKAKTGNNCNSLQMTSSRKQLAELKRRKKRKEVTLKKQQEVEARARADHEEYEKERLKEKQLIAERKAKELRAVLISERRSIKVKSEAVKRAEIEKIELERTQKEHAIAEQKRREEDAKRLVDTEAALQVAEQKRKDTEEQLKQLTNDTLVYKTSLSTKNKELSDKVTTLEANNKVLSDEKNGLEEKLKWTTALLSKYEKDAAELDILRQENSVLKKEVEQQTEQENVEVFSRGASPEIVTEQQQAEQVVVTKEEEKIAAVAPSSGVGIKTSSWYNKIMKWRKGGDSKKNGKDDKSSKAKEDDVTEATAEGSIFNDVLVGLSDILNCKGGNSHYVQDESVYSPPRTVSPSLCDESEDMSGLTPVVEIYD